MGKKNNDLIRRKAKMGMTLEIAIAMIQTLKDIYRQLNNDVYMALDVAERCMQECYTQQIKENPGLINMLGVNVAKSSECAICGKKLKTRGRYLCWKCKKYEKNYIVIKK